MNFQEGQPDPKRCKIQDELSEKTELVRLATRLGGILCCAVCLDLPSSAVFQCPNGHLMCGACFTHLMADACLRDETAMCPNCRTKISTDLPTRNLAVEKAIGELPTSCRYCGDEQPRHSVHHHATVDCLQRPELLICSISDLHLRACHTEDFIQKLFHETGRFSAHSHQWMVRTRINNEQKDPTQSVDRHISFQLALKTKTSSSVKIHFVMVHGPYSEIQMKPLVFMHDFTNEEPESPWNPMPLKDPADCNKLLMARTLKLRYIHL
ncbi:unnamed protein product [Darwinula stevensoni]|uniref:RING-type domain-containing protein n=1 Tax=Darwinula stevensoni TaxID=69355 RepID=A0A7R9A1P0_9CRUS|nr:unnamed protein product [Darwinula stevensoni]CAG0883941.1 unnamed protein product [Darwinula stevensoni]